MARHRRLPLWWRLSPTLRSERASVLRRLSAGTVPAATVAAPADPSRHDPVRADAQRMPVGA